MNDDTEEEPEPPWMTPLDAKTRDAVRRNVAQAPPLTEQQRNRLRLLFRHHEAKRDGAA